MRHWIVVVGLVLVGNTVWGQGCDSINILTITVDDASIDLIDNGSQALCYFLDNGNQTITVTNNGSWPDNTTVELFILGTPTPMPVDWTVSGVTAAAAATFAEPGTYEVRITVPGGSDTCIVSYYFKSYIFTVNITEGTLTDCEKILNGEVVGASNGIRKWYMDNMEVFTGANYFATQGGNYRFEFTADGTGCTDSDSTVLSNDLFDAPTATITATDSLVTCTTDATLSAMMTMDEWTYSWSGDNITSTDTTVTITSANAPDSGSISLVILMVTNTTNGCTDTDSIEVMFNTEPPSSDISLPDSLCQGTSEVATVENASSSYTYTWTTGTGSVEGSEFMPDTQQTGIFPLSLTVTDGDNGCVDTAAITYTVVPPPNWESLLSSFPTRFQASEPIELELPNDYTWRVLGGSADNVVLPSTSMGTDAINWFDGLALNNPRAAGQLTVQVAESQVCMDSSTLLLTILPNSEGALFLPEILSPNGDGINDEWNIGLPDTGIGLPFQLWVYDRSGRLVYETDDPLQTWRAQDCPNGSYYYQIEWGSETLQGAVTVIGKE